VKEDKITKEDIEDFISYVLAFLLAGVVGITFIVGIIKLCIWIWTI